MKRRSLLALGLLTLGCPKPEEIIVATAEGEGLSAEDIDRDPLALLPGNAVGWVSADTLKLNGTALGKKLLVIAGAPVPPSAGFRVERDLHRLIVGLYSMQGLDVVGVAKGTFDAHAIETAAEKQEKTPLGAPVVKSQYAGRTLYTANNIGFVILTPQSALFGNETGIRRALDRIKEGRVRRQVPKWMDELLSTPNAPMVVGTDLRSQPITESTRKQMPFLNGLHTARLLGNFHPPGMNFAGTLTYDEEEAASNGVHALQSFDSTMRVGSFFTGLFGFTYPVTKLQARVRGKDAQVVAEIDGQQVSTLVDTLSRMLGMVVPV